MIEKIGEIINLHLPYYFHTDVPPEQSKLAYYLSTPIADLGAKLTHTKITGSLPNEGPALIVFNHLSGKDIPVAVWLAIQYGRGCTMVAKRTIINPGAPESEQAVKRRTDGSTDRKPYNELSFKEKLIRQLIAQYTRQFGPIPVDVGMANRKGLKELLDGVYETVSHDQLVGIFVEGTRRPALDLMDIMEGVGLIGDYLLKKGLDVPIIPVGLSGTDGSICTPITIHIGDKYQLSEIPILNGLTRRESITLYVRDSIGPLVEDYSRIPAWLLHKEYGMSKDELRSFYDKGVNLYALYDLLRNRNKVYSFK